MTDPTDEDVAKRVLARLKEAGPASLRDREGDAPVSRGTISRWDAGDYSMKPVTKRKCLAWLGESTAQPTASYVDGLEEALEEIEEAVERVRLKLTTAREAVAVASRGKDAERRALLDPNARTEGTGGQ